VFGRTGGKTELREQDLAGRISRLLVNGIDRHFSRIFARSGLAEQSPATYWLYNAGLSFSKILSMFAFRGGGHGFGVCLDVSDRALRLSRQLERPLYDRREPGRRIFKARICSPAIGMMAGSTARSRTIPDCSVGSSWIRRG
jgi:hypothetical protein